MGLGFQLDLADFLRERITTGEIREVVARTHRLHGSSLSVGLYLESYKVIPKRNHNGAYGKWEATLRAASNKPELEVVSLRFSGARAFIIRKEIQAS